MSRRIRADALRQEVAYHRANLTSAERALATIESGCAHQWSGVDRHQVGYFDRATPAWRRTCAACGKVEETEHTRAQTTQVATW